MFKGAHLINHFPGHEGLIAALGANACGVAFPALLETGAIFLIAPRLLAGAVCLQVPVCRTGLGTSNSRQRLS